MALRHPWRSGRRTPRTTVSGTDLKPEFAKVKPALDLEAIHRPRGRLWVGRYGAAGAKQVVYDVFDRRGARVDRIALPAWSRIVGFGSPSLFAAELNEDDLPTLRKYRLTRGWGQARPDTAAEAS